MFQSDVIIFPSILDVFCGILLIFFLSILDVFRGIPLIVFLSILDVFRGIPLIFFLSTLNVFRGILLISSLPAKAMAVFETTYTVLQLKLQNQENILTIVYGITSFKDKCGVD